MSRFLAAIYDASLARSEAACLAAWRGELLAGMRGTVVELGAGTGLNIPFYPRTVERAVLTEPDRHMLVRLRERVRGGTAGPRTTLLAASADRLPLASGSADAVVATLVLCTVPDPRAVLAEVRRVLRPEGTFVFLEHVAAAVGSWRRRLQRVVEPVWRPLADGCHLTRDTEATLLEAGFRPVWIKRDPIQGLSPLVRPSIRGVAVVSETGNA